MTVFRASTLLCAGILLCLTPARSQQAQPAHWSYEGEEGPQKWGQLDPAFGTCANGHEQSPIDIRQATPAELPPLKFDYSSAPLNIVNNGHTIQVNYPPGSTLTVGDKTYALRQFHFHHPSEEHVDGRGFELVAHLVHADESGRLAVVAVLFQIGPANAALETIWSRMPAEAGNNVQVSAVALSAKELLPGNRGYYTFRGSLTTPPCSEGVTWFVLKEPATLSQDQAKAFAKIFPNNARPIQPTNEREVLQTK